MNKQECIRILNIATNSHISYIKDNKYRFELQYKKDPKFNDDYKEIIEDHNKSLQEIDDAFTYLETNLK